MEDWKDAAGIVVTTQAHEGIETVSIGDKVNDLTVTTQAHEGIET